MTTYIMTMAFRNKINLFYLWSFLLELECPRCKLILEALYNNNIFI